MRNMSNIPKLPAHRERSSCCSVKVGAHNKEECERTLTSQWPSCPATLRSQHTASAGGLLPETRAIPGQNGVVWRKKKKNTDRKVWLRYKMNARRKTHRGVATKTRAHAKVLWLERKLRPQRRSLQRWEKRSKRRLYFKNYIFVQDLSIIKINRI